MPATPTLVAGRRRGWIGVVVSGILGAVALSAQNLDRRANPVWLRHAASADAVLKALNTADAPLPPVAAGVNEINFAEFFGPVGDRGLEYSAKLRALAGQQVRVSGYMVREPKRPLSLFLLAERPLTIDPRGGCSSDVVPPSAVHVVGPNGDAQPLPYRPGRIVVVGKLELEPRVEADGRNSVVRLILDVIGGATP